MRLLQNAGIHPEVVVSGMDETTEPGISTEKVVAELAERKALAVSAARTDALVLGCDSMLELDGMAYGKPASASHAAELWRRMSGREGTLFTGHCLIWPSSGRRADAVGSTVVRFAEITEAEIAAYVATDEPAAMAGAFSLECLGAPFVAGIDGDPSNVVGLSLPLLRRMLAEIGIPITSLWAKTVTT